MDSRFVSCYSVRFCDTLFLKGVLWMNQENIGKFIAALRKEKKLS